MILERVAPDAQEGASCRVALATGHDVITVQNSLARRGYGLPRHAWVHALFVAGWGVHKASRSPLRWARFLLAHPHSCLGVCAAALGRVCGRVCAGAAVGRRGTLCNCTCMERRRPLLLPQEQTAISKMKNSYFYISFTTLYAIDTLFPLFRYVT